MFSCPYCQSANLHKRGTYYNKTENANMQRFSCVDCEKPFSVELPKIEEESNLKYTHKKYVITSCQNDTLINREFYNSLLGYCKHNDAKLIVLRTKYNMSDDEDGSYLVNPEYLLKHNIVIADKIKVFGGLQLSPTLVSPLSGLDSLSAGYTCVFGASSYQMRSLPINQDMHPIIMTTTGSMSIPNNSDTKTGQKADYNHSFSALIIELEDDEFHMRVMTADDTGGFYDLTKYYSNDTVSDGHHLSGIVLGDIHVAVADPEVIKATYTNQDSILHTLKPKQVFLSDLLDFHQLGSHHNRNNYLKRYSMYMDGNDDVEAELQKTMQFLIDHNYSYIDNTYVISSNHIDHLTHWLNGTDIKSDYKNSIIYHFLLYKVLISIKNNRDVNAFELYFEEFCKDESAKNKTIFLGREDSKFVHDILVSQHGDKGPNGARGFSPALSKKMPYKMIIGHCHTPYVEGNLWAAGTLTGKLDYACGSMSGWMNSSVAIYPNGTRTHINIVNGKWKL